MAVFSRFQAQGNGASPPLPQWRGNTSSYTGELYYVDGFDEETNTVFEFYGCYFHGCPRCFKRHRDVRRTCYKDWTVHEV